MDMEKQSSSSELNESELSSLFEQGEIRAISFCQYKVGTLSEESQAALFTSSESQKPIGSHLPRLVNDGTEKWSWSLSDSLEKA